MTIFSSIRAAQRLDSRGNPTVQVTVHTNDGAFTALVPSGASVGAYEAHELRDGDAHSYGGAGVTRAVRNVNDVIEPAILRVQVEDKGNYGLGIFNVPNPPEIGAAEGQGVLDLRTIDRFLFKLDGTEKKSNLGANAILGVSMAVARAAAAARHQPLYRFLRAEAGLGSGPYIFPTPFFNVLNGGRHSGNGMAFQEFMVAPTQAASMADGVRIGAEIYRALKAMLVEKFGGSAIGVGDEGGFAPPITHPTEALDLLRIATQRAGHEGRVSFGLDPASSEFYRDAATSGANAGSGGKYDLGFKLDAKHEANGTNAQTRVLTGAQLQELYKELLHKYPEIILLEDPFAEDDWEDWAAFHHSVGNKLELVGDDLLATNVKRMGLAKSKDACNSLLLKVNQIGSVTEAIDACQQARAYHWRVFLSHRSGETTDPFIADLAVALGVGHLKSGSPARGERVVKYNRLMDIEEELVASGIEGSYAGRTWS